MQMVDNARVVVYLMTGFLESGKTQFLRYTLGQEYFEIDGNTVLILCEEGEEEYPKELLEKSNTTLLTVDDPEDLTLEWLEEVDKTYKPERVIIECNGMYPVSKMEALDAPKGWGMVQKLVTVDASTFGVYVANMKPLFVEMVRNAELVLFNRCNKEMPLASYRRSVKVVNPGAEIIFEGENDEIDNIFEDSMPYDLDASVVEIEDMDYGIWYVDMMEHPEKYLNKTVEYKAKVLKPRALSGKEFLAGRMAMTCCADDTTFLGYVCRSPYTSKLASGQWVKIRGTVGYEYTQAYRRKGPVIRAEYVEVVEPLKDELVYFN